MRVTISQGLKNPLMAESTASLMQKWNYVKVYSRDTSDGYIDQELEVIVTPDTIQTYIPVQSIGGGVYYWLVVVMATIYLAINKCL